jgi:uncharacterized protein
LAVVLAVGSVALSSANWAGFLTPVPPAPQTADAPPNTDAAATGAVNAPQPGDASRPNELSRTTTDGGSAIITVMPMRGDDEDPDMLPAPSGSIIIRDPSELTQTAAIAHMPLPELLEKTGERRLPRRAEDGTRPFDAYAGQWSGTSGPRIAIVIAGLGLSQTGTQNAIKSLPAAVTLALASEGNSLDRWMQAARRDGHEIMLQVPMQPQDGAAPGRHTLETELEPDENRARLHRALARTTNYVGIMNFMGARFTADEAAFMPVMAELSARGLMYLDDGTSARSLAPTAAGPAGVPFAQADMMIDVQRQSGAILQRLNDLEQIARSQGIAIGVGSAFDETVATVANWMNEARKRGIEFVPISAAAADPEQAR